MRRAGRAFDLETALRWFPGVLRSGGARRARWGIVDQGISSITNFGVTAVAARYSDPERFGAFSFGFGLYVLALWIARSLVAEPFVIRLTEAEPATRRAEARRALGASCALGTAGTIVMVGLAAITGEPSRPVLLAMGLGLPALLLQDTYRYVLIASGRTGAAAGNDGLWLALQSGVVVALVASHNADAVWLTVAFGAAAALACGAGWLQTGVLPALRSSWDWLRRNRDLGIPFLYELTVINGMAPLTVLAIGLLGDVVTVGHLRSGTLLLSPPTVMCAGVFLVGLPEAVRLSKSPGRVARLVLVIGLVTSLATLLWALAVALVPDRNGMAALDANWAPGRRLLLPIALLTAANAWMLAIAVGLRALGAARQTLALRSFGAPVILALGLAGALLNDSGGAAAGLAVGAWVSAALSFVAFRRVLRGL